MAWYPRIPDNIQWVVSDFKPLWHISGAHLCWMCYKFKRQCQDFGTLTVEQKGKTSCANIRLSCHSAFSICCGAWNLPPSLLPVSLFFSSLFHPHLCQLRLSSLVCINLWLRDLEIWGAVIWLAVTAGRCEEQTTPKQTPKPI